MPRQDGIWENITYYSEGGETSPFIFNGREYFLVNMSPAHDKLAPGMPEHAVIIDAATGERSEPFFKGYYFISAYSNPQDGKVYCFAPRLNRKQGWISAHAMDYICSDDLVHWSDPAPVIENYDCGCILNTGVAFDGERYVMFMEVRDTGKPFSAKFLESRDMKNWTLIEGAMHRNDVTYFGAGAIYYIPEQKYFYITYLYEFINDETGCLNYCTNIARSMDLFNWEVGKRPILFPDYGHRVLDYPEIAEINCGDAEFIEIDGKVKVYSIGGNQLGKKDCYNCWYNGSMGELFASFFE